MTTVSTGPASELAAPSSGALRKTKWSVIWLLTLTIFSALTVGGILAPLQEAAKADLGLDDLQLGLIVGVAGAIPATLLAMPIAWLVDHGTRTRILIVLASMWALGAIGMAFVDNFYALFAARLVSGIGAGTAFPVLISLLADVCVPERRGRSMLVVSIGAWAGAGASFAIGGTLFGYLEANPLTMFPDMAPWRQTHLLVGLGSALCVLPLFLMREPRRHEVGNTNPSVKAALRAFWRQKAFLGPLFVGNFAGGLAEGAAAIWMGSVLIRQYNQTPGQFGVWVGVVIVVSGLLGSVIGGFAADAGQKLKMRGGILLPALIATALSIPASLYPVMPTVSGFAWVLFFLLIGGSIVGLVNNAAIAVLIPNEERALCLAALKIVGTIVGGPIAAVIIGWVSSVISGPGSLGVALAWLGVLTGIISLIGFWIAMANAPAPPGSLEALAETAPDGGKEGVHD
ncbi:MFS transporter [Brevundimonas sp. G8]|uniref:MFS transporter n=1 Tax=Brevundimonas sp. G8 TaxID=1350776 RepID=UPI0012EFF6E1|nr:MFS transporter [Brevundimonas sp. G8]VXB65972.1 conserved membrane hypothetical protein [Brevundimonas sp. G8]